MNTFFTPAEINREIERAYTTMGYVGPRPTWEWNAALTRCMGMAYYAENRLEFSFPLFMRATEHERRETIVHEACHILAYKLYGKEGMGHGNRWKFLMIRCGEKPLRCHSVDISDLKRKVKKVNAICGCVDRKHVISANKAGRMRNETSYYICRHCKKGLEISE